MAEHEARPAIIAVCGPTASGKTELAIRIAQAIGGEIVCADSMQIYSRLAVGTARPTPQELAAAPHHLYGTVPPERGYSVSDYVTDAKKIVRDISARGNVPVLCGGTGLYLRAFVSGVQFSEAPTDLTLREEIRLELERRGAQEMIEEIAKSDPELAGTLHPNNRKRIVRTLELIRANGQSVRELNEASMRGAQSCPCVTAVLYSEDRAYLYGRIEQRVDKMMRQNLLDEARLVYDNRDRYKTAAQAIGYKEFFPYFEGTKSLADCVNDLKQATRRYAKRQLTWFRREPDALWFDIQKTGCPQIVETVLEKYKQLFQKQEGVSP